MSSDIVPDQSFCRRLPKVELHAHLNGSISRDTLQAIWEERTASEGDLGLEAPVTALETTCHAQGIDVFFAHFGKYIYKLVNTPTALARATWDVLRSFHADGVSYLELRTTPRAQPNASAEECVRVVLGEISRWNDTRGEEMRVRLILSIDRARHAAADAFRIAQLAVTLHQEGHPVVGLDLCGDVKAATGRDAVSLLRPAYQLARDNGMGCVLHFAEVPGTSSREELEEQLSWMPKRLGHAIYVPADLREKIMAQGIAVELCLSCNVLAGMLPPRGVDWESGASGEGKPAAPARDQATETGTTETDGQKLLAKTPPTIVDHHFGWWWARGGPLSLGTDDVGVFGASSSDEHYAAAANFNLTRADLVRLSHRAIAGLLGTEADRAWVEGLLDRFAMKEGLQESLAIGGIVR